VRQVQISDWPVSPETRLTRLQRVHALGLLWYTAGVPELNRESAQSSELMAQELESGQAGADPAEESRIG